ncbi:MAG: hypothetical protein MUP44_01185 [Anaerolineales bacterium]|nr:hypothetical protein [Anaerolineales bacterium]
MWDSTKTALSPPLAESARMPDISYAGTALNLNGAQYFWRIKFWDNTGEEGAWSATQTFYMAGESSAYRSIGTNAATLYAVGTASISQGSSTVTFADGASLPGNVGQGDKLTISSEVFYIKSRDSATQVTVQEKAGAGHSGEAYIIARAYNTISAWEADRQADLVAENRIEVGVAYNDGPFDEQVTISGSTTDASHYMHLTVASGQRHDGTAGTGTRFHPASVAYGTSPFQIQDHYFIIEWVDFDETDTGGHSETLTLTGTNITARYLILRGARNNNTGINVSSSNSKIYNNFIYKISNQAGPSYGALWLNTLNGGIEAYNNTVFGNTGTGITFGSGSLDHYVKSNISVGNTIGDYSDSGAYTAANNLSSDDTARGINSLKNKSAANQLISVTDGWEDLHLRDGADALDAGVDLSATFSDDIDGDSRPQNAGWDIGADERHFSSVTDQDITFTNITLNGLVQTLTGSTNPWQVESTAPAGTAWSVAISASDFNDGSHAICMNSLEVRLLDANIVILTGSDKPSSQMTSFTPLSGSGQTLLGYSGSDGVGIFEFTPEFQLHLPAETYTGSYSATVTVTYILGPW